jgi:hypothetical protein
MTEQKIEPATFESNMRLALSVALDKELKRIADEYLKSAYSEMKERLAEIVASVSCKIASRIEFYDNQSRIKLDVSIEELKQIAIPGEKSSAQPITNQGVNGLK